MIESEGKLTGALLDAALVAVGRWGLSKTTMADVAKLAGSSRATVYRAFPGGKDQLFAELGRRELGRFFASVGAAVDATDTLEDALVVALVESARQLRSHAALQYVLDHEPEFVLPVLGFRQLDRLYRAAGIFARPHLARFLDPGDVDWAAEWIGRLLLSYLFVPTEDLDPADPGQVRPLVRRFVLPALAPSALASTSARPTTSTLSGS